MGNVWMVRAGEGGNSFEEFEKGIVAIGWHALGDLTSIGEKDKFKDLYLKTYPGSKPKKISNAVAMIYKFRHSMKTKDGVITYDPINREYLVGSIDGDYQYSPNRIEGMPHIREVKWEGKISRDALSTGARNALGSALSVFLLWDEHWNEIQKILKGDEAKEEPFEENEEGLEELREDVVSRAHELIKDKILTLDDHELEELVAAILRAMGYKARVSPMGPDRGVDVTASLDGLGLQEPRIKVEVKHQSRTQIGTNPIRSFLAVLREGDRGIFVSSGGFSKEARYEAERATQPVTLVSLDDLAGLVITHYDNFDLDGRALLPLVRVYWPA